MNDGTPYHSRTLAKIMNHKCYSVDQRHLFSEEKILRVDQKIENGRPIHLYGSKSS